MVPNVASKRKKASPAQRRAALKGWATRRAREAKRSAAALKGWETRRKNERERKKRDKATLKRRKLFPPRRVSALKQNREYLVFVFSIEKGKRYFSDKKPGRWNPVTEADPETERQIKGIHSSSPRILVIFDAEASERAVVAFAIYRIERDFGEDWQWVRYMLQGGNRRVEVAKGKLTSESKHVRIGKA